MTSSPEMSSRQDCLDKLLEQLKATLDLLTPPITEEYAYQSLPLCVLDAIFSINAKYESTRKVVIRYCDHYGLQRVRQDPDILPPIEDQESLSGFIGKKPRSVSKSSRKPYWPTGNGLLRGTGY